MSDTKARLEAAFVAPIRNEGLRKLYGKSLRGGLLLDGAGLRQDVPRAGEAGEMGAAFVLVTLPDVPDVWIGQSETNLPATGL